MSIRSMTQDKAKFQPTECHQTWVETDLLGTDWLRIYETDCDFDGQGFFEVVHYLVRNPNVNSSTLFRADILYDSSDLENVDIALSDRTPEQLKIQCPVVSLGLPSSSIKRHVIRRFVPRNDGLDKAINQSVFYYELPTAHIVVMTPHVTEAEQIPFYHPRVSSLAFVHTPAKISISYLPFVTDTEPLSTRQRRTAFHLLKTVWKHGQGNLAGYKKRIHHDQILPQKRVQDRFADLKKKYATRLITNWVETTEPSKQVFEQIGIAAFLIELWHDIYAERPFPGFVDVGCGNSVLMEILLSEGYSGWGIEGHKRKTWQKLSAKTQKGIVHGIVVPAPLDWLADAHEVSEDFGMSRNPVPESEETFAQRLRSLSMRLLSSNQDNLPPFHNGIFNTTPELKEGPFIISNHADELTGWTPFMALLNNSCFFAVPCCSRNLSGERFRAPSHGNNYTADTDAPKYFDLQKTNGQKSKHISIPTNETTEMDKSPVDPDKSLFRSKTDIEHKYHFVNAAPLAQPPTAMVVNKGQTAESGDLKSLSQKSRQTQLSGYQSLCCWVVHLADACGFLVEREMLRLPSTRNFGIVGRFCKGDMEIDGEVQEALVGEQAGLRERMDKILEILAREGGASRAKWVGVCEKEVVKGNDFLDHGVRSG